MNSPNHTSSIFKFSLRDVLELTTAVGVMLAMETVIQRWSNRGTGYALAAWLPILVALAVARRPWPSSPLLAWPLCGAALIGTGAAADQLRWLANEGLRNDIPPIALPGVLILAQLAPLCVFLIAFFLARFASKSPLGKRSPEDSSILAVFSVGLFVFYFFLATSVWNRALSPYVTL